jgi:cytochrome c553
LGLLSFEDRRACIDCSKQYKAAKNKYKTCRTVFQMLFGYCPCCERYFRWHVKTQRRNTAYCDETQNWLTACKACHKEDEEYFADLWEQYYSSI